MSPPKELSTVLKSMGYNPTKEEIMDMVDQVTNYSTNIVQLGTKAEH